jgi:hypothetical protein
MHHIIKLKKENNQTKMKSNQASFENSVTFRSFSLKIPKWGGSIEVNASELFSNFSIYNNMPIIKTCTIDYFHLAVWSAHWYSSKV